MLHDPSETISVFGVPGHHRFCYPHAALKKGALTKADLFCPFSSSLLLTPLALPFFSPHFLVLMSGRQGFFIVDDNDSRVIDYSETPTVWFPSFTGSPDDAYQGTITSGLAGAKATMKFKGTLCAIV